MARWLTLRRRPQPAGMSQAQQPQVLEPYTGISWYQRHRRLCLWILGFICCIYGYLWAIAGQYILTVLMGPIALILALLVWLLPETERTPQRWLEGILFAYLIALLCWPNYLAIALPGLPWITLIRLTGTPLAVLLLISLSMSRGLRSKTKDILNSCPGISRCVMIFAVICLLSIGLSRETGNSVSKFVDAQFNWTSIFFVSCIVFTREGSVRRLAFFLWGITLFVCLIGLWEWHLGRLPWVGHIPSFLAVDDPSVQRSLSVQTRSGTDTYRVHSKFATSLGMGEFLAIAAPFLMHFAATARRFALRAGAVVTLIMLIFCVHLTDSRLAAIGFFMSLTLYLLIWAVTKWRSDRTNVLGALVTLSYPVLFAIMFASTFFVGRIRVEIWGDGSQAPSNEARKEMFAKGIPMIFKNPFGYGIGEGGMTLGFYNGAGTLTIDTYYLLVGLEFGVVGFLVYYGMHIYGVFRSAEIAYKDYTGEFQWLGAIGISLFNFVVIKSVFSGEENHPLIFLLLGVIVALSYRYKFASRPAAKIPEARDGEFRRPALAAAARAPG